MFKTITAADSPYILDPKNTESLPLADIQLPCDTTDGPIEILLPVGSEFPVLNLRVFVTDESGTAGTNNITVFPSGSDLINGANNYVISDNYGFTRLHLGATERWTASSSGSGGAALMVSKTYDQLIASINASTLIPGQQILLTDFQTAAYIQYSGPGPTGIGGEEVTIGAVEPLVLRAISSNKLSAFAESPSYPGDQIIYTPVLADREWDYCEPQGKGCIVFRKDLPIDSSRDYDFRTVVFRRWETVPGNNIYLSITPVAGSAFQDSLCYGPNAVFIKSVNVRSQLGQGVDIADGYWLDNTIFNINTLLTNITLAFGNTIAGNDVNAIAVSNNINIMVRNSFYFNTFAYNDINEFSENSIYSASLESGVANNVISICERNMVTTIVDNRCTEISQNEATKINANSASLIQNNVMPASNIIGNVANEIYDNTCSGIEGNNSWDIHGNSNTGIISGNVSGDIDTNSNAGKITSNIAEGITNNSNTGDISFNTINENIQANTNVGNIKNNTGSEIIGNDNNGGINANEVSAINANSRAVGLIANNIGFTVSNNSNSGDIQNNVCNRITQNGNSGLIENNNVQVIKLNLGTGAIYDNVGVLIEGNSTGAVYSNNVHTILNNLGLEIYNNVGWKISTNNISSKIHSNQVREISGNTAIASISGNVGDLISNNSAGGGSINDNKVKQIYNNTTTTSYNITSCDSAFIINNTLEGTAMERVKGSVKGCAVGGDIKFHNFISDVETKTITPTVTMSSTTPTQSIFDESDSKHYIMLLSAGVYTAPTAITN